ncbi:MAG: PAS domain-containing sensor histidine kinase [Methanolinea sp.]|nr:PAS domain-containing sensor histidine kinase [Methanolinea sp.]
MICASDREGRVLYLNRAFASFLGRTMEDMEGKPVAEALFPFPIEIHEIHRETLADGKKRSKEIPWTRDEGPEAILEGLSTPIADPAGVVSGVVLSVRVRERYEADLVARAAENSRRKQREILAIVRHDILNQLTILIGFLQFSEDFIEDPRLKDFLAREETAGTLIQHLTEFTREFQDMALAVPGWFPVSTLIDSAKKPLKPGKVVIESDISGIEIFANPLVEKVFYTLMENALVHGGSLTRIALSARQEGGDLVITCEDDGNGIPPGDRALLFERGHGKNTGYNIWLAGEILSITGASLTENSMPGEGAKFAIRVPSGMWRKA